MGKQCRKWLYLAGIFLLLSCVGAYAQRTGAGICGRVCDDQGHSLEGVSISVLHQPTRTRCVTRSNRAGCFALTGLLPGGPYQIEVTQLGMVIVVYEDVFLSLGEDYEILPVLQRVRELGQVAITEKGPQTPGIREAGAVMDRARIEAVPTVDRSLNDVLVTAPLAVPAPTGGISILGMAPLYNGLREGGIVADPVATVSGEWGMPLSMIESIRLGVAPADVRDGEFAGGSVDVGMRAGSNRFGGEAYTYQPAGGAASLPRYGVTLEAPILRDRVFLFAGGEYATGQEGSQAQAAARLDAHLSRKHRLSAQFRYADTPLLRQGSAAAELHSRFTDKLSNELRATYLSAQEGMGQLSLTEDVSLLAGSHHLTFGTTDLFSRSGTLSLGEWSLYAQDRWRVTDRLTLLYGLRAEYPQLSSARLTPTLSPRLGLQGYLDPLHRSLLRLGAGLYTGRVPLTWLALPFAQSTLPLPRQARVDLGFDQVWENGWMLSVDAVVSKTLQDLFFTAPALGDGGRVYAVQTSVSDSGAPYFEAPAEGTALALDRTSSGYIYSLSARLGRHFDFGLDLSAAYALTRSFSVFNGSYGGALAGVRGDGAVSPLDREELSLSRYDRPQHLSLLASYSSPRYGICRSTVSLLLQGVSGQHFSYTLADAGVDFNGDGVPGNSLLYIPTEGELVRMRWSDPQSAALLENYIRSDEYLSAHRGAWSNRYAGSTPFETRFDLRFAQDFYFGPRSARKLQLSADLVNAGNLLSATAGACAAFYPNCPLLQVDALTREEGGMVPTYSFHDVPSVPLDPIRSAWRLLMGAKLYF